MQAGSVVLTGSAANFAAPCACAAFRLYSSGSFTFQWAIRAGELASNQNQSRVGQGVGATITAEEVSTTDYFIEVHAPYQLPFNAGEIIGILNGNTTVYVRPIRVGRE
jgi:hypothetical protein